MNEVDGQDMYICSVQNERHKTERRMPVYKNMRRN